MKKNMMVGIALAMGVFSTGIGTASAAGSCCDDGKGKCSQDQVSLQFTQETTSLSSALKSKDLELREIYGYDSINIHKADVLESG
jgi:hypothetical protein